MDVARLTGIVWLIGKIVFYNSILNVLFAQTYNFVFVRAKRPTAWIGVVAVLGVANMALAYALSWDSRLVGVATLLTVIWNIPPSLPKGFAKTEVRAMADEIYEGWGIKHGSLKNRLGLVAFAVLSLAAYVLFFGESCNRSDECVPLIRGLFF
jgi:hypothetical protein